MYLFLTVCTMLSFFVFQSKVKNNISNKRYFILALLPIALYCLTYGFRKGWGKDYEVYSNLFEGNSYIRIDSYEPLFRVVVVLLRQLSESSTLLLVVVAAMTIFSYVYILKEHKSVLGLKGVYPFFSVVRPQQKRPMYAKGGKRNEKTHVRVAGIGLGAGNGPCCGECGRR